jgi:L-amino acid N-acyltransferase YncA
MIARPARRQDLPAILTLQRENLEVALPAEEVAEQGFVTVVHDLDTLEKMHALAPSIVVEEGGELLGYALMMPFEARDWLPVLQPMFDEIAKASFRGRPISRQRWYVMGQICVAKKARGRGVFQALYEGHKAEYARRFDAIVTEIATRNRRSLRAHERQGFEVIHTFRDATDDWVVVAWDFGSV